MGAVSAAKVRLSQLAREHSDAAFATLVDVCENGTSEGARITAAVGIGKTVPSSRPYGPSEVPLSYFNAAGRYIRTGATVILNTYPSVVPSWR